MARLTRSPLLSSPGGSSTSRTRTGAVTGAGLPRRRWARLALLAKVALALGCAGPPVAAPIQGEPVCPDFASGAARTRMQGSLRFPVQMRILDGKTVVMKTVLIGKRLPEDSPSHTFVVDDNAEYTVEWAQCPNERATLPADQAHNKPRAPRLQQDEAAGAYECGEAVVYKTDKLVTKKGDPASHTVTFVAPPKPECWVSDAPLPAAAAADAGAPDAAVPDAGTEASSAMPDAGDAGADASTASTDGGAPADGGARSADAGAPDAAAPDAAAPDAAAPKSGKGAP
uniref:Uncharacterized protein n=1 Tax=Byssovorax cruenta TaxID=293647 RepID=A0A3S5GXZ4_9BACT|nr:hypothetical protein [Byssovorax cruenta]